MNKNTLKIFYISDGIVLLISYIYFFMFDLSRALQNIGYAADSWKILQAHVKLQKVVEFGVYYESAVWFWFIFFLAILITAIFSAIFYRKIISRCAYLLLTFSALPILSPYIILSITYLFSGFELLSNKANAAGYIISLAVIAVYAVFTGVLMCKNFKMFDK